MDEKTMLKRKIEAVRYYADQASTHLKKYARGADAPNKLKCLLHAHTSFALLNYFAGLSPMLKQTQQLWTMMMGLEALIQLHVSEDEKVQEMVDGLISVLDSLTELWGERPEEQIQLPM